MIENDNILDQPAVIEKPDFMIADDWYDVETSDSMLDLDDEMEYLEQTLRINGSEEAAVTSLNCVSGQAGNGKTLTMTLMMSVYLGARSESIELLWKRDNIRLLYVDTEMEKGNTQLVVARLSALTGIAYNELKGRLYVMRLRDEPDASIRWKKILKAVWEIKPDVTFIDGVIDIMEDFNDNREANAIIWKLMSMAEYYNMTLWTVLHQNPGTTKMAGHGGSFMERKCALALSSVWVWDNEEEGTGHFEIRCLKSRSSKTKPIRFHTELFQLPNGTMNVVPVVGMPEVEVTQEEEKIDCMLMDRTQRREFFESTITKQEGITTGGLRDAVKRCFKIGSTKADRFIDESERMGIITRGSNKEYHIADITTKQDEAPF